MALKTVKLGVSNTHSVPTGARVFKRTNMDRRDNTRSAAGSEMTSFSGGQPAMTGIYKPTPMPTVRIFVPYESKFNKGIV